MNWKDQINFADGDQFLIIVRHEKQSTKASVQLDTDAAFDGNNSEIKFVQSNNIELDPSLWHDLPEAPLKIPTGTGSSLLSTFSFTAQYLAVMIDVGNATTGTGTLTNQFNQNT